MFIRHISLRNYRNYARLELDLAARVHLFVGENAQGKTNLLEAVYYLATTRSPLASHDRELIRWESFQEDVIPNAQIALCFVRQGEEHTLEASLVQEPAELRNQNGSVFRRQLRYDGVNRRAIDIVGRLNVVLFLPEDIALVAGSPSGRRRYLDVTLCQIDARYCRSLARYNRVIIQRNALLRRIREGSAARGELAYWNAQVAQLGAYVMGCRMWALAYLSQETQSLQRALTGDQETLTLAYEHTLGDMEAVATAIKDLGERRSSLGDWGDLQEILEQGLLAALQQRQAEEIARGVTVVGPHRDDFRFIINGYDARIYGSRGQQRTAAIALKLAEVNLMRHHIGEPPVLLLDDILSELDHRRGAFLLESLLNAHQVLVTATSLDGFPPLFLSQAQIWKVSAGQVFPWEPETDMPG